MVKNFVGKQVWQNNDLETLAKYLEACLHF